MKVEVIGAADISAAFSSLLPQVKSKAIARLAQSVYTEVLDSADKHHRKNGLLRKSLELRRTSEDEYFIYHDDNAFRAMHFDPYWKYVQFGTRPHVIKPNKRKVMRWPGGNGFVFAKFVKHPGYKGDAYMVAAVKNAPAAFEKIVQSIARGN